LLVTTISWYFFWLCAEIWWWGEEKRCGSFWKIMTKRKYAQTN